jgi:hypothetical protein
VTAPSYTEDLTDVDDADDNTNWAEPTATGWDDGSGGPDADSDWPYIQGNAAISQLATKAGICAFLYNNGSGITLPTDGAYLVWTQFSSNRAIDTYANGGIRLMVGSSLSAFKSWDVGGSDKDPYPYGGWACYAANSTVTADDTVGSPTPTEQYVGSAIKTTAGIGKGQPHTVDMIRYGRCSSIFEYGDLSNGYCTFAGFAAQDETDSNRWGLAKTVPGGYQWKGRMQLGTSSNAVDFRDSGESITWEEVPKVTANFNLIEINNASSRVDWTNIIHKCLSTVSKTRILCNANADLNWDLCQFYDFGAITFGGTNSTCTDAIFNGCGIITAAGATLNGSNISGYEGTADTSPLIWNVATDPDGYLDDMSISKGTAATHAIEFGTSSPLTMTVRGMTFTGYNVSNGQNDSTFHVKRTSGTVTINVVGGTGNFTYKSAGATVVIVPDAVTVAVHAADTDGDDVQNARVFLQAKDGTGPFPFEITVTIVNSGTTATVTHTGHGMASNDYVEIKGANHWQNNGAHQITVTDVNTYTYTMPSDPGSSPSGTIKSTFVALTGLTDVNGDKSISRVYPSDQPVIGWIRLTPTYKTAKLFGTIDNVNGYSATGVLIDD